MRFPILANFELQIPLNPPERFDQKSIRQLLAPFRALLTEKGIERLKSDLARLRDAGLLHPGLASPVPDPMSNAK